MSNNAINFAKKMAFTNLFNPLEAPADYGIKTYEEMFDLITGDVPFDDFPFSLQWDIGSLADLDGVASDLQDGYSTAMAVLRSLAMEDNPLQILSEVKDD